MLLDFIQNRKAACFSESLFALQSKVASCDVGGCGIRPSHSIDSQGICKCKSENAHSQFTRLNLLILILQKPFCAFGGGDRGGIGFACPDRALIQMPIGGWIPTLLEPQPLHLQYGTPSVSYRRRPMDLKEKMSMPKASRQGVQTTFCQPNWTNSCRTSAEVHDEKAFRVQDFDICPAGSLPLFSALPHKFHPISTSFSPL